MTVWKSIEEILNENPNIMINIEKTHGGQSCLSITMTLIDPQTFRSLYKIRRIADCKELKTQLGETNYEDIIAKHVENMYLELKTKMEENNESYHL